MLNYGVSERIMTFDVSVAANRGMFVREKTINGYSYLYLVESVREDGRTKQRILKNLGRKDAVLASGGLERLAASVARKRGFHRTLQAVTACG